MSAPVARARPHHGLFANARPSLLDCPPLGELLLRITVARSCAARSFRRLVPDQFLAQRRGPRTMVLRRIEQIPNQISKISVRHLLEAFGHDAQVAHADPEPAAFGGDVAPGDALLLRSGAEETKAGVGVFDQPSAQDPAVLRLDLDVFVACADD